MLLQLYPGAVPILAIRNKGAASGLRCNRDVSWENRDVSWEKVDIQVRAIRILPCYYIGTRDNIF